MESNTPQDGDVSPQETAAPNPLEEKALHMGWRPQDEWDGDPDDWVDAKEYVGRQKLYDRIQDSNKRLKQLEKTLNEFKGHHEKVKETEFKRALDLLKAQKVQVLQDGGEPERLVEIDDKILEVREQLKEAQKPQAPEVDPDFQRTMDEWVTRNKWYSSDTQMKKEADLIGYTYVQLNGPGDGPEHVLKAVETEMRKRYPEKFVNPRKEAPGRVETSAHKSGSKDSGGDVALTDEEAQAMRRFVRQGVMTEKQYKEEIKKMRGAA